MAGIRPVNTGSAKIVRLHSELDTGFCKPKLIALTFGEMFLQKNLP